MTLRELMNKFKNVDGVSTSNAKIKYVNRSKQKVLAIVVALGLTLTLSACSGDKDKAEEVNPDTTIEQPEKILNPAWSFDPNSAEEMQNRIANFILDARAKGQEIPVDKAVDLYLWLNINELTPAFLGELNYATKTEETISRSVEYVGNILKEDTMTSRPDTIIDVMSLVANKKDAASIRKMQAMIADWNAAELKDKKALADELNAYVNDVYLTDKCREYGYTVNVVALTFLRGMEIMSINTGNPIPAKDVANILYYDGSSLCLEYNPEGKSKYSQEWTVAKEVMEAKLGQVVYTVEGSLGYSIEYAIMGIIDESNVVLGVNPDINAERDKNDTTVYKNEITGATPLKPSDKVVTDPKTGEKIVVQPQTPAQKEQQQEQIQENLQQENKVNTENAQKDAQSGADAGFKDGFGNGQKSNPRAKNVGKSQAYIDGYNTAYDLGVAELKKFLADQAAPEEIIREEYTPVTPIVPGNSDYVAPETYNDDSYNNQNNNNNNNGNQNNNNNGIDLLPGYHYGEDGKIYDENGNVVEIIAQTSTSRKGVQVTNLMVQRTALLTLKDGTTLTYDAPKIVGSNQRTAMQKSLGIMM